MIPSKTCILLALVVAAAGGCAGAGPTQSGTDGGTDGGTPVATRWKVASVVDLGAKCTNPGSVAVTGTTAWVGCSGDFAPGDGRLARVDLASGTVTRYPVAGAPGPVAIDGSGSHYTVFLGDLADGRFTATDVTGSSVATPSDPGIPCPSDPAKNVYEFIGGIAPLGDGHLLATCFATDRVIDLAATAHVTAGKTVLQANVTAKVTVGDGPGALAAAAGGDYVVLDGLAGTATMVHTHGGLTADVDRYQTGQTPNGVAVDGGVAYVANSGDNTLLAIDLATGKPRFQTPTGDGTNPWSVAVAGGQAFVTLNLSDEVVVIDTATGKLEERVALPKGKALHPFTGKTPLGRPEGIATTAAGEVVVAMTNLDKSYTAAGDGLLVVLEPTK